MLGRRQKKVLKTLRSLFAARQGTMQRQGFQSRMTGKTVRYYTFNCWEVAESSGFTKLEVYAITKSLEKHGLIEACVYSYDSMPREGSVIRVLNERLLKGEKS